MSLEENPDTRAYYVPARRRLEDARVLLKCYRYDGARYLAGFAVECVLKALILVNSTPKERPTLVARLKGEIGHDLDGGADRGCAMRREYATDQVTRRVEKKIRDQYLPAHPRAAVQAYRYNGWSIRVRVIDPDFEGRSLVARDNEFVPILKALDESVQDRVTMLLLLTPEESQRSDLSQEFDEFGPSTVR
jgi:HEPN domain-containing protein